MKIGNAKDIHGNPLLTKVVASGMLAGDGTPESPLEFTGLEAFGADGSAAASGVKSLVAGEGVSLSAGESGAVVVAATLRMGDVESAISSAVSEGVAGLVSGAEFSAIGESIDALSSSLSAHAEDTAVHVPAGGESGQFLKRLDSGAMEWASVDIAILDSGVLDPSVIPDLSDRYAALDMSGKIDSGALPDLSGRYAAIDSATGAIDANAVPDLSGRYAELDFSGKIVSSALPDYTSQFVALSSKDQPGGYVGIDSEGHIPSRFLPTAVDDILAGYYDWGNTREFYESYVVTSSSVDGSDVYDIEYLSQINGRENAIYVDKATEKTYRWSEDSSVKYVEISPSLVTGTTPGTAYPGEYGAALASSVDSMDGRVNLLEAEVSAVESSVDSVTMANGDYVVLNSMDKITAGQPYFLVARTATDFEIDPFIYNATNRSYIYYVGETSDCEWSESGQAETGHVYAHFYHAEPLWGLTFPSNSISAKQAFKSNCEYLRQRAESLTKPETIDYQLFSPAHNGIYSITLIPPRHEFTLSGLGAFTLSNGKDANLSPSNGLYVAYGDSLSYAHDPVQVGGPSEILTISIGFSSSEQRTAGPISNVQFVYLFTDEEGKTQYGFDPNEFSQYRSLSLQEMAAAIGGTASNEVEHEAEIIVNSSDGAGGGEEITIGVVYPKWIDITGIGMGEQSADYATKALLYSEVSSLSRRINSSVAAVSELPTPSIMTVNRVYCHADVTAETAGHTFVGRSSDVTEEAETFAVGYGLTSCEMHGGAPSVSAFIGKYFTSAGSYVAGDGETYDYYSCSEGGYTWYLTEYCHGSGSAASTFPILTTTPPAEFAGDEINLTTFMPVEAAGLNGVQIPFSDLDYIGEWYYRNDNEYGTQTLAWSSLINPSASRTAYSLAFDGAGSGFSGEYADTGETKEIEVSRFDENGEQVSVTESYPIYADGNGHYLYAALRGDGGETEPVYVVGNDTTTPVLWSWAKTMRLSGTWSDFGAAGGNSFNCVCTRKYYHAETHTSYALEDITPAYRDAQAAAGVNLLLTVPNADDTVWLVVQKSSDPLFASDTYTLDQRVDQYLFGHLYYFNGTVFATTEHDSLTTSNPAVIYPGLSPAVSGNMAVVALSDWEHCGASGWYRYKWVKDDAVVSGSDTDWMGGYYPGMGGDSLKHLM